MSRSIIVEEVNVRRTWVKGHFYSGMFYGLCFGCLTGVLFIEIHPLTGLMIALLAYAIKNKLEESEFKR